MTRIRLFLVAAFVLAAVGCPLLEQQENFISFSWDGVQYFFTASADRADHPYAVGYANEGQEPYSYEIWGSATAADALDGTDTIRIELSADGDWYAAATIWDSYGNSTWLYLSQIPYGMLDTFIANRDAVGGQFTGTMPGPFQGETPVLENVIFSVERLPNEEPPVESN